MLNGGPVFITRRRMMTFMSISWLWDWSRIRTALRSNSIVIELWSSLVEVIHWLYKMTFGESRLFIRIIYDRWWKRNVILAKILLSQCGLLACLHRYLFPTCIPTSPAYCTAIGLSNFRTRFLIGEMNFWPIRAHGTGFSENGWLNVDVCVTRHGGFVWIFFFFL